VFLIPSPSSTAIQSFIPAFEKKTGIKVNFSETPYGEAHQKELLSYQQKAGAYDVAQFDNTYLAAFGAAKVMTPLDDYLSKSTEYDIADFSKGQQDYGKHKGATLGLTLSTEPMIQWYRTDIYDALGLKPATTWDEFYANAKAVEDAKKGDGAIIGFGAGMDWWWMTLVWSFGGHLYDDKLKPTVDTPEAKTATDYMNSLLPLAPKGAITASGDDVTAKFLAQDIGAKLGCGAHLVGLRRTAVGGFELGQAVTFEALEAQGQALARERLLPPEALVRGLARLDATDEEADHFGHGRIFVHAGGEPGEEVAIHDRAGRFLGVARRGEGGRVVALRLMSLPIPKAPVFA